MTNGPALWDKILAELPDGAVIAGGAVRDFALGVEPKDIDVFISSEDAAKGDHNPRFGLGRIDSVYERKEEYQALTGINQVSTGTLFGYKVDLVEMDDRFTPSELVASFDFGINQCWYEPGGFVVTRTAEKDWLNSTVTLCHEDRMERSLARFARFNERHNGRFKLIDKTGKQLA